MRLPEPGAARLRLPPHPSRALATAPGRLRAAAEPSRKLLFLGLSASIAFQIALKSVS